MGRYTIWRRQIRCTSASLWDYLRGCNGAPDWVIEIVSPSNSRMDYGVKLFKYRTAGVREYWIVDPRKKTVMAYDLEKEERTDQYGFEDDIQSCICEGFVINIERMLE